jgi:hypothetical protein
MLRCFVVVGTMLVILLSVAGCGANQTLPPPLIKDGGIEPAPKPAGGKAG